MLQRTHYDLLDKLRFGKDSDERKMAMKELINLESEAQFNKLDVLKLLEDKDPVIQVYAIGAIGRQQVIDGVPELKRRYVESSDPLILNELLNAFQGFESDDFLDIVVEKLRKLYKKPWLFQKHLMRSESSAEKAFILGQILIPSLNYIQKKGSSSVEKTIKPFLTHEDANVRWHALKTFDTLTIPIKPEILQQMAESDPSPLVREQAAIITTKQK